METQGGGGAPGVWKKVALIGVGVGIGVASSYCFLSLRNYWWGSRADFYIGNHPSIAASYPGALSCRFRTHGL